MTKLFKRFVEVGRVTYFNHGPWAGKLATIVDILDQNRVLIDGPKDLTGIERQVMNLKGLSLSDFVLPIKKGANSEEVAAAFKSENIQEKWENSKIYKKFQIREKRAQLNDFERFIVRKLRRERAKMIRDEAAKILKEEKEKNTEKFKKINETMAAIRKKKSAAQRKKFKALSRKIARKGLKHPIKKKTKA